jgi:hypothetical protein
MNYWLHRISHHAHLAHPLLFKHNILTIGFSEFSSQNFIDDVLEPDDHMERLSVVDKYIASVWGRPQDHRTRYNIWRFIEGFREGDMVVVPTQGKFSVFKLIGKPEPIGNLQVKNLIDWHKQPVEIKNLAIINGEELDLGFYWNVEPVEKWIERYEYADAALTARMKIRSTTNWLEGFGESIERSIVAKRAKKPINLHATILEKSGPIILENIKKDLDPDKLERLVQWYFSRIGATHTHIPSKNERDKQGDADVVAIFEPLKTIYYVQVKFHNGTTGNWATHQIVKYRNKKKADESINDLDDGYNKISWVVSTADNFDEESLRLAQENRVQLINGKELSRLILEAGISDLNGLI